MAHQPDKKKKTSMWIVDLKVQSTGAIWESLESFWIPKKSELTITLFIPGGAGSLGLFVCVARTNYYITGFGVTENIKNSLQDLFGASCRKELRHEETRQNKIIKILIQTSSFLTLEHNSKLSWLITSFSSVKFPVFFLQWRKERGSLQCCGRGIA